MAARPRDHKVNIPNLYCKLDKRNSKTYWQYRHPLTGQFIGFGTDQDAASQAGTALTPLQAESGTTAKVEINERKPDHMITNIIFQIFISKWIKVQAKFTGNTGTP